MIGSTKKKIVFFVKQGLDNFLEDIIKGLSDEYETKKVLVTNYNQIDEGMEWADICWFEWCDELIEYGSRKKEANQKIILCRLHSYEAFAGYTANVNWDTVNRLIFVGENIREFVIDKYKIDKRKTVVIPNGVDCGKYTFKERKAGFHIAYVGYINYKKGAMLLLHTFKTIYDRDGRYKLYIAGQFQDDRDLLYFKQMIKEFGIEESVFYEGWQENLDLWLEDKNYILCTSLLESQNLSVMQAMAKGIKPIIHNFAGAKIIYGKCNVWNTIDEAVQILEDENYNSKEYLAFINDKYSLEMQQSRLKVLFQSIHMPLVTVGITNYNGSVFLEECINSFLNQTYGNIEILFIDDCSTDGSKEIIQEYEKNHKNIKAIYHQVNSKGVSKGIQEIIENAQGQYFQWIACDDYVQPNAVESFVNYLEENREIDYAYSDLNIVDENSRQTGKWEYTNLEKENVVQHIFNTGSGVIPMNCMYRKSFFQKKAVKWIVYRDNDFSADTLNCLHFIRHNWNYGKIDKALINYRIHSSNLSHNLEKRIKASVALYDYIICNFSEEVFLPQIDWTSENNKEQRKKLCFAQFYYMQIQNHINMKAVPGYLRIETSKDQIEKYCRVYAMEGLKYVNEGIRNGTAYINDMMELKKFYEAYLNDRGIENEGKNYE